MPGLHKKPEILFLEYFFNVTSDSLSDATKREMTLNCKFVARKLHIRLVGFDYDETMHVRRMINFFEMNDSLNLISYHSYCAINGTFVIIFHRPSSLTFELLNNPNLRLCK